MNSLITYAKIVYVYTGPKYLHLVSDSIVVVGFSGLIYAIVTTVA